MKIRRKVLITIDILFLIFHVPLFVLDLGSIDLSKPFYIFMRENLISFLVYHTAGSFFLIITDFVLMIINVCLFIKMLCTNERDDAFPIIAIYAVFLGLSYFSILIGVLYGVLMS